MQTINFKTRTTKNYASIEVWSAEYDTDLITLCQLKATLDRVKDNKFLMKVDDERVSFKLQWGVYLYGDSALSCIDEARTIIKEEWCRLFGRENESELAEEDTTTQ